MNSEYVFILYRTTNALPYSALMFYVVDYQ